MPIIIDCIQGTPEWDACRRGIPTASKAHKIVTPTGRLTGKDVRQKYMDKLAGEAVSGRTEESFVSYRMQKGTEAEEESCRVYAMAHEDLDVYKVGFVYKDERKMFGYSPDRFCDPGGLFETKDAQFDIQIPRLRDGKMVNEHIPQCQSALYCCEREWVDFQSYCSGLPELCIRLYRDEKWIALFEEELEKFCYDLVALIKKLKERSF